MLQTSQQAIKTRTRPLCCELCEFEWYFLSCDLLSLSLSLSLSRIHVFVCWLLVVLEWIVCSTKTKHQGGDGQPKSSFSQDTLQRSMSQTLSLLFVYHTNTPSSLHVLRAPLVRIGSMGHTLTAPHKPLCLKAVRAVASIPQVAREDAKPATMTRYIQRHGANMRDTTHEKSGTFQEIKIK